MSHSVVRTLLVRPALVPGESCSIDGPQATEHPEWEVEGARPGCPARRLQNWVRAHEKVSGTGTVSAELTEPRTRRRWSSLAPGA